MTLLTRNPIDVSRLLGEVGAAGLGGTALFVGTVRRSVTDGPVASIDYTAYEAMAEAELHRILADALVRWPEAKVAAQHRLGPVATGETSVAVAAACPHRAEAFEMCRYIIEEIKRRLPIWKREIFEDGSVAWRGEAGTHVSPAEGTS